MRSLIGRASLAALVSAGLTLLWVSPAMAHIDPEPSEAPAGSSQSIGFTVGHGCDGSPTVQLDMRLPEGVPDAVAEPPEGWTGSVAGNVLTFTGGPLPDAVEATFRVRMTLPATAGETVYFPFVQRCQQGEIRWIDVPTDGAQTALDEPAPALLLTEPLPATTNPPETSQPSQRGRVTEVSTSSAGDPTPTTSDATTVESTSTTSVSTDDGRSSTTGLVLSEQSSGGSSSAGTVVFIGALLAVAVVAALVVRQARRRA